MSDARPRLAQRLARRALRLVGWSPLGERPLEEKFVLIAAPHTSNWDLPLMLLLAIHFDLSISWVGKHTLFRRPFGGLMRWLGGIAVDRRAHHDLVAHLSEVFANAERLVIAVPAEGTRGRTEHWKSGFYWIARGAGVPIVLGTLDYATKRGGFGPTLRPTGNVAADMDLIRAFYADKVGLHPEKFGPVRLADESGRS